MSLSLSELSPSARFIIKDVIGDTLQGRMYRGMDTLSNEFVAIKETWKVLVQLSQCRQGTKIKENHLNEISILNYLSSLPDCPLSIIRILRTWEEPLCYMYAMEYCHCSLFNYIKKIHEKGHMKKYCDTMQKLPQRTMNHTECLQNPFLKYVQRIFIKLGHAVSYLHSKHIVHLDLSLENIMLNGLENSNNNHIHNPSIKIIDFGLAKKTNNFLLNERCGKLAYMAPEVFVENGSFDGRKADIWSMGVILFIMLIGTHLVAKPCVTDQRFYYLIKKGVKPLLKNWRRLRLINEDALDLMNKIFVTESNRIDMTQLLVHPFLNRNRYFLIENNHDFMHENVTECTPTPSLISRIRTDSSTTDNWSDYQMNVAIDDDEKSQVSYPIICGLDVAMNDDIDTEFEANMNINIESREQSKVSLSEPDGFINPRIGKDGQFEFGLSLNNKNKNKTVRKIKNQLNSALKELDAARQEIDEMKHVHASKTNAANMEYSKISQKYEAEYKQKTKLLRQIQESTQKYDKKLAKSQTKTSELQQEFERYTTTAQHELNQYKLSNKRLQQQLSDHNEHTSNTKTLQHENSKLVAMNTSLQNQVTTLSEILFQYKQTESKQAMQIQTLKSQIAALKSAQNLELSEKIKELSALQLQLDDYKGINEQQMTELQAKVDAYEQQQISEEIDEKELENTFAMVMDDEEEAAEPAADADDGVDAVEVGGILNYEKNVSEHRVLHVLEKSHSVIDVAKLVMEQYTSRDTADEIAEEEEIDVVDTDSSYSELEKLQIEQMISLKKEQKGIVAETVAMQKQMEQMERENVDAMRKRLQDMSTEQEMKAEGHGHGHEEGDSDESTTQEISVSVSVSKEDGGDMTDAEWAKQANVSHMFRYKSIAKWTQQDLAMQKNEMQAQYIHMLEHHVKATQNVMSDDEKKSNLQ